MEDKYNQLNIKVTGSYEVSNECCEQNLLQRKGTY